MILLILLAKVLACVFLVLGILELAVGIRASLLENKMFRELLDLLRRTRSGHCKGNKYPNRKHL